MELRMIIFLLTFFCLYGSINFYFFFRARSILHFSGLWQIVILILLILLIAAPVLVRVLEALRYEQLARAVACIGYLWMAFVFLFFFISLSFDLVRLVYKIIADNPLSFKTLFFGLAVFFSLALVVYGYFDAQNIRVQHLKIATEEFLPGRGELRIVQISDVHVGIVIRERRLDRLLQLLSDARPDILVCTGDFLDGELDNIMDDAERFAQIPATYGKIAILGNHEYYAGLKRSVEFIEAAGFQLLRDDYIKIAGITVFGEDDITGRRPGATQKSDAFRRLLRESREGFVLLLKHQPHIDQDAKFNLQLSGHTHGGQLYPFGFIVKLYFPKIYGLHELAPGKLLYVSRGTGTWGPPVRVFAPPEITVIDLIGKKSN
ncbi:MAG TPA: metallophosphoesterase [Smithellaceae bacterium]|nr:metallophosphoesterase [Smithellaceae bacterium]HRS89326.1 metallophosphoesterase [Smithellaceae bacterium]HRV25196.1 metallophosphoesterase [Smithellaceae bacterium]